MYQISRETINEVSRSNNDKFSILENTCASQECAICSFCCMCFNLQSNKLYHYWEANQTTKKNTKLQLKTIKKLYNQKKRNTKNVMFDSSYSLSSWAESPPAVFGSIITLTRSLHLQNITKILNSEEK